MITINCNSPIGVKGAPRNEQSICQRIGPVWGRGGFFFENFVCWGKITVNGGEEKNFTGDLDYS